MNDNLFAAPDTAAGGDSALPGGFQRLQVHGTLLRVPHNAQLPEICVITGEREHLVPSMQSFSWQANGSFLQRTISVAYFVRQDYAKRQARMTRWGYVCCGVAIILFLAVFFVHIALAVPAMALIVIWRTVRDRQEWAGLRVERIDKESLYVSECGAAFLQQVDGQGVGLLDQ